MSGGEQRDASVDRDGSAERPQRRVHIEMEAAGADDGDSTDQAPPSLMAAFSFLHKKS